MIKRYITGLAALAMIFGSGVDAQAPASAEVQADSKAQMEFRDGLKAEREKMEQAKEDFRRKVQTLENEQGSARAQLQAESKIKLDAIKNTAKKAAVQNINDNLSKLNNAFIEKWTKVLSDLDEYIARISEKIAVQSANGRNMYSANRAISSAETAIASARIAIEAQAQKIYFVSVSTEANLKIDASSAREMLNTDLKSTKDMVQAAHASVVDVLVQFNKAKDAFKTN